MVERLIIQIKHALISLLVVFSLVSTGHTPIFYDSLSISSQVPISSWNYWGYRKLAEKIGNEKTHQVIEIIESSDYPELIKAVITIESLWEPFAISTREARGLMQIRMIAAKELRKEIKPADLYDPVTNVNLGIQIFEQHMNHFLDFNEPLHWALTSYNRGRYGTFALNLKPPRTRYSNKVLALIENL
ncbi:MAG: lytic transglycosylase domain-containing protein [Candidatus Hatepunaea meridiana]|nr:lytic transglycosylase domain-containing protein [Candidatus Hatepunaea meridiana]